MGILVILFILYRISSRVNIAHYLLKGLEYWRPPSDQVIADLPAPAAEDVGKPKSASPLPPYLSIYLSSFVVVSLQTYASVALQEEERRPPRRARSEAGAGVLTAR